jgi:prophage antirepressor-like protein
MEIQKYSFNGVELPILGDASDPLFEANIVCDILEYANSRDALSKHVDEDDVAKRDTIDSLGRTQQKNYLTESGLFSLILSSKKPEAKIFKRWVTKELLPTIRKTGSYSLTAMTTTMKEAKALGAECGLSGKELISYAARYVEAQTGRNPLVVLGITKTRGKKFTVTQVARMMHMAPSKLNQMLADKGYQTPNKGRRWSMTAKGYQHGSSGQGIIRWKESIITELSA